MSDDNRRKREEEKRKFAGEKVPSMKRRSELHDYHSKCFYMVTLVVEDRRPLLGMLVGDAEAPEGSGNAPRVVLTPLGQEVAEEWERISSYYPQVAVIAQQVMPDHLHGILYVRETTGFHLGQVIKGFKIGCNRILRAALETQRTREGNNTAGSSSSVSSSSVSSSSSLSSPLSSAVPSPSSSSSSLPSAVPSSSSSSSSLPSAVPSPSSSSSALPSASPSSSSSALPPASSLPPASASASSSSRILLSYAANSSQPIGKETLWEPDYNDKILHNYSTLEKWKAYLSDNPRRLAVRRAHPEFFCVRFGVTIAGQEYAAIGNMFLLKYPDKVRVQLSRQLTDEEIQQLVGRYLALARRGTVLVSPAISKAEQTVMRAVLDAHLPLIFLTPWGFNTFSKPGHQYYEACAEGRFLILAPWEHQNERVPLTRTMCVELNTMAAEICK